MIEMGSGMVRVWHWVWLTGFAGLYVEVCQSFYSQTDLREGSQAELIDTTQMNFDYQDMSKHLQELLDVLVCSYHSDSLEVLLRF